jgi:hypothetical protein
MATKKEDAVELNTADKMLEEANAKIEKMLADAEKTIAMKMSMLNMVTPVGAKKDAIRRNKRMTPEEKAQMDYMEEKVPFRAFKDNDKYKDDIFVSVNGENCIIKRGVEVKIKRKFYDVIKRQENQDDYTNSLIEEYTDKFYKASL